MLGRGGGLKVLLLGHLAPPLRTLVIGFRVHPNPDDLIQILYLIASSKTLFPNEITFIASWWTYFFWGGQFK